MSTTKNMRDRRKERTRHSLYTKARARARLSVFRSHKHIYAQVIDDTKGVTLASASSIDRELRDQLSSGSDKSAATKVGRAVAERAKVAGISDVIFDRGAYLFHGRVKALADAAREAGLKF